MQSSMFIRDEQMLALLLANAQAVIASRPPDQIIRRGDGDEPYMERWHIVRHNTEAGEIGPNHYIHRFVRSDAEEQHDHPWANTSVVLHGSYFEEVPAIPDDGSLPLEGLPPARLLRRAGDVVSREAKDVHAIRDVEPGTITLFVTGPKERDWGFHTEAGWIPWRQFRAWKDGQ